MVGTKFLYFYFRKLVNIRHLVRRERLQFICIKVHYSLISSNLQFCETFIVLLLDKALSIELPPKDLTSKCKFVTGIVF